MRRVLIIALCMVFAAGMVFAQGVSEDAADVPKIGIAVPSPDHGWTGGIGWWADKAVEELKEQYPGKYEFKVLHADGYAKQISDVEDLMVWGMDYLVILPHESAPLTPVVKEAHDSGVKCIVVDRGLTDTSFGYINLAGNNSEMGKVSGIFMRDYMKEHGLTKYVAMGGMPVVIDGERMNAFFDEMQKEPSLVNLAGGRNYDFADWSTQKGLELMENYIQKYPEIHAVYCQDDDVMTGVLQAIKESGRKDIKLVFGGAGSKAAYEMIMNDDPLVKATATYHPSMVYDAIMYCLDVAEGRKSDAFHTASKPTSVVLPSVLVDKSNVMDHYDAGSVF
jgi:ribose transport system substrate-binding protein